MQNLKFCSQIRPVGGATFSETVAHNKNNLKNHLKLYIPVLQTLFTHVFVPVTSAKLTLFKYKI